MNGESRLQRVNIIQKTKLRFSEFDIIYTYVKSLCHEWSTCAHHLLSFYEYHISIGYV